MPNDWQLPDKLVARIDNCVDGRERALRVLQYYFVLTDPDPLTEADIEAIREGMAQIERGETATIDEARVYVSETLDKHMAKREQIHRASVEETRRTILGGEYLDLDLMMRLDNAPLFAHCGEPEDSTLADISPVYIDRSAMKKTYASVSWQSALVGGSNVMSGWLSVNAPVADQKWNDAAHAGAAYFDTIWVDTFTGLRETFDLNNAFVLWNRNAIIGLFLAAYYKTYPVNTHFNDAVLRAYEAGRFPCGWTGGTVPEGRLLVW